MMLDMAQFTERRDVMFWIIIAVAALVMLFVKLGAVSVWVTVFSVGLKLALLVIAGLTIALIWKTFSKK